MTSTVVLILVIIMTLGTIAVEVLSLIARKKDAAQHDDEKRRADELIRIAETNCDRHIAEKDSACARLLAQKEEACAHQLAEKDKACELQLAEKDKACARLLAEKEDACKRLLDEKDEACKALVNEAIKALQERFANIAETKLKASQESLGNLNRESLAAVFAPFKDELHRFRADYESNKKEHSVSREIFDRAIRELGEKSLKIGAEAENLARALRRETKTQGDWGEMVLSNILVAAGFKDGIDFVAQAQEIGPDGEKLIPDVEIPLPNGEKLLIDSKTSVTAYLDYVRADDDESRDAAAKQHVASVRKHLNELADKDYIKKVKGSQGYILMFIPNEGSYILAMERDRTLAIEGFKRHVIIANPTTLLLCLHIVALLRSREKQNENAEKIAAAAAKMYEKMVGFMESFNKVGNDIKTMERDHNEALKRLCEGKGNVVRQLESLKEMGVNPSKAIPESIRDASEAV